MIALHIMNRPTSSTFLDDSGESVDEKCSFDAEFSLLESTLIDLKDEPSAKNNNTSRITSDKLYTEATAIITQSENHFTPINDLCRPKFTYDNSVDCSLLGQCSNKIKPLNDIFLCTENELNSQHFKSINVPVYNSEVNNSNHLSSNNSNQKSNYDTLTDDNELQKSFHDEHINCNTTVSICDSSVEVCKNKQLFSPINCMTIESKNLNQMVVVSGIEDCDKNCINDSTNVTSEIGTSVDIDCTPIQSSGPQQLSSTNNAELKDLEIMPGNGVENNTPSTVNNLTNCNNCESIMIETNLSSKLNAKFLDESEDRSTNNVPSQKADHLEAVPPNNDLQVMLNCDLPINCEIVESSDSTPKKNKINSVIVSNFESCKEDFDISNKEIDQKKHSELELLGSSGLFCSTPITSGMCVEDCNKTPKSGTANDFENVSCKKNRNNLKRKFFGLECIEEVDEDASDLCGEKKIKYEEEGNATPCSKTRNEDDISSSMTCLEAPAKSILKKWQTSSLSRASGSTYFILDECGESEAEENIDDASKKSNHDIDNTSATLADDFEIACNSLNEELMKGSSNIEALEKYYSQVQLENQMDDEMFDEVLQELTSNVDFDDKTSVLSKEEPIAIKADATSTSVKTFEVGVSEKNDVLEDKQLIIILDSEKNTSVRDNENCTTNKVKNLSTGSIDVKSDKETNNLKLKEKVKDSTTSILEKTKFQGLDGSTEHGSIPSSNAEKNDGEDKMIGLDEEDVLLEEDLNSKVKPYEFREFVSTDPKENEDNYNPEWKKLGQLTSDEERYKAVRDRWRSLIPPDPNRDLTCRQWRDKNNKPPLNLPTRNNNHKTFTSNERNHLCTTVFDMKIKKFLSELDECRLEILRKRNMDFNDLAITQDREQSSLTMRNGSMLDLNNLRRQHIEDCRKLKHHHDVELDKITRKTNEKIRILKDASEEVLLFQKFYKGFNAKDDDEGCLYMTDIQVQELMETEEMLEQYTKFYNGSGI